MIDLENTIVLIAEILPGCRFQMIRLCKSLWQAVVNVAKNFYKPTYILLTEQRGTDVSSGVGGAR